MKTRISLLIILSLLIFSCSKQEKSVVKGKMENAPSGEVVFLKELRASGDHLIDSIELKRSGKFRFVIPLKTPGFYHLLFSSGQSISLILSPGEKIELSAVMNNFYDTKSIIGSANTIRLNMLHDSLRSTTTILDDLRTEFFNQDSILSEAEKDSLANEYLKVREGYHRFSSGFILEDLKSLANIGALYQEYTTSEYVFNSARDIQFFRLVSDTLSKYYPDVRYVKTLKENYQSLYNDYQTRRLMQSTEHKTYDVPEITLPDQTGILKSLSSLKGRIVLLTFWTIDQEECIENTLALKKIYEKFRKNGFEIYQVAFNKAMPQWKKAIKFEEIQWISVIDTSSSGSKVQAFYNVHSLPMNYLIDKEQKEILAKNISPEDLRNSLPQLLTKKP
jgi:peroxiredoxin